MLARFHPVLTLPCPNGEGDGVPIASGRGKERYQMPGGVRGSAAPEGNGNAPKMGRSSAASHASRYIRAIGGLLGDVGEG